MSEQPEPLPQNYTHMCPMCFAGCKEIGMLAPRHSIILKPDGKYWILGGEGHTTMDEIVCCPTKPFPDPDRDCLAEDGPIAKASDRWMEEVDLFEQAVRDTKMTFWDGHAFVEACRSQYERSSYNRFEYWVFNRVGEIIEIYEGKRPPEPKPPKADDPETYWNYRVMKHVDPLPENMQTDEHDKVVWYGIHEYYYGLEGGNAWSTDPEPLIADSVDDLRDMLAKMRRATMEDLLDYPEEKTE